MEEARSLSPASMDNSRGSASSSKKSAAKIGVILSFVVIVASLIHYHIENRILALENRHLQAIGPFRQVDHSLLQSSVKVAHAPCSPPHCIFTCAELPADTRCIPSKPFILNAEARECKQLFGRSYRFHPISFAIPEEDIVSCVPFKSKDFAQVVPYDGSTYVFHSKDEDEYKRDYRMSYFAITRKKAGWDCMRHYEILAGGGVPYFLDIEEAPPQVMITLPKDLLLKAKSLAGVDPINRNIDFEVFNQTAYYQIACQLLQHTRQFLTTEYLAEYVLQVSGNAHATKILYLSSNAGIDYMRDVLFHGLKQLMAKKAEQHQTDAYVLDAIRLDDLYVYPDDTPPLFDPPDLYGYGFSIAHRLIDDPKLDRKDVAQRIKAKQFDTVIFGSIHRGMPHFEEVTKYYPWNKILYIDGEDDHGWKAVREMKHLLGTGHYFLREIPATGCPNSI